MKCWALVAALCLGPSVLAGDSPAVAQARARVVRANEDVLRAREALRQAERRLLEAQSELRELTLTPEDRERIRYEQERNPKPTSGADKPG